MAGCPKWKLAVAHFRSNRVWNLIGWMGNRKDACCKDLFFVSTGLDVEQTRDALIELKLFLFHIYGMETPKRFRTRSACEHLSNVRLLIFGF